MALKINSAEGGTNATSATTGNSGGSSGNAFYAVTAVSGSTVTYSNEFAAHGTLSYKLTLTNGGQGYPMMDIGTASARLASRFYIYLTALPTAIEYIAQIRSAGSGVSTIYMTTNGRISINDASAGVAGSGSPAALPLNQWLRIELTTKKGTSTTDGEIAYAYYAGDSTTPIHSWSSVTVNAGTADLQYGRYGRTGGVAATNIMYIDDIALADLTTGFIGPYSTNNPPSANAGVDQTDIEPWSIVTLNGSDGDSDGTIATRIWRQVSGSPTVSLSGTGASRTYTAPPTITGTSMVFGYQVTDDGGTTSTEDTTVHTILPATERAVIGGIEVPMRIDEVAS